MNNTAFFLMILSMVLLWGGLLWATLHLIKHPDPEE